MSRMDDEVQRNLPSYVAGTLPRWRSRLVDAHVRGCEDCAAALEQQRLVSEELGAMTPDDHPPPEDLLDRLLEQAQEPGVKGRVAVPARGAVSGARPGLSVLLLLAAAAMGSLAGWGTWRGAKRVRRRS